MAQKPNPFEPFTADEFVRALRLVATDDEEARRIEQAFGERGTETARATGWGWSDDFLVLLSLESEELRLKVERFRREELHITDPAEQKRFEERRALLKHWLDTSDPTDRTRMKPPNNENA
jgi:hypothetical protein